MKRPKLSIRRMMILVAILGVATWLAIPAIALKRHPHPGWMYHVRENVEGRELDMYGHTTPGPFWSRYRRRLLGQPWPGSYPVCHCGPRLFSSTDEQQATREMLRLNSRKRREEAQRAAQKSAAEGRTPQAGRGAGKRDPETSDEKKA